MYYSACPGHDHLLTGSGRAAPPARMSINDARSGQLVVSCAAHLELAHRVSGPVVAERPELALGLCNAERSSQIPSCHGKLSSYRQVNFQAVMASCHQVTFQAVKLSSSQIPKLSWKAVKLSWKAVKLS